MLNRRRSDQRRTRHATVDGELDAGIGTLDDILCLKLLNNRRSYRSFVAEHLTLLSVLCFCTLDALLCTLFLEAQRSSLSKASQRMRTEAATNRRSQTNAREPTLTLLRYICLYTNIYSVYQNQLMTRE